MGAMYLDQKTPEKLVELVRLMALQKHWVKEKQMKFWANVLRKQGYLREADELSVAGRKMPSYRSEKLSQLKGPPSSK